MEEEVNKIEEDTSEELAEGSAAHIKMELTPHMSPVTLNIQIGPHSKTIQGKGYLRAWYVQSF